MTAKNIAAWILNILAHILPIPFAALQDQYGEVFEEKYPCKSCGVETYVEDGMCLFCKTRKYQESKCDALYKPECYITELFEQKEV